MKLSGEKCFVEINVLGYQYATASLKEDLNWLTCKVSFVNIDVAFSFNCLIQTYDLAEWMKSIKAESQIAVLAFPEDECSISIRKENGYIRQVEILYKKEWMGGDISQKVVFTTQMLVKDVCGELEELLLVYPVL